MLFCNTTTFAITNEVYSNAKANKEKMALGMNYERCDTFILIIVFKYFLVTKGHSILSFYIMHHLFSIFFSDCRLQYIER